jgi:hypothetical protein
MELLEELLPLEEQLLAFGVACDRACAEALLAEEFREFGGSGRVLSRAVVMTEIGDAPERSHALSEAACTPLGAEHALLTYRVVVDGRESIRGSLWVRRNGRWQMLFHQGTRVPVDSDVPALPLLGLATQ